MTDDHDLRDLEPAERVERLLEAVSDALGLGASVEVEQDSEAIRATLHGDDLGLFIGRHGTTIDAVQHLAYKLVAVDKHPAPRVVVDAAGYRARREQALHRQADQAAENVLRGGRPVALDAMSATERKVVHEYLKERSRGGDVLRGHRAGPPSRRGAARERVAAASPRAERWRVVARVGLTAAVSRETRGVAESQPLYRPRPAKVLSAAG